jgi:hypothetical protein
VTDRPLVVGALDASVIIDGPPVALAALAGPLRHLRLDAPAAVDTTVRLLVDEQRDESTGTTRVVLTGGDLHASGEGTDWLLNEIVGVLNASAARSVTASHGVLHAAAVDVGAGVVAICGVSGAGKTTLAAACVRRGAGYVADEVCATRPTDLHVRPYHRPLGLRPEGATAIGQVVGPDGGWLPDDILLSQGGPLIAVVMVDRQHADGSRVRVDAVRPAAALVELTSLTLQPCGVEAEMFTRLDQLVRRVPVARVVATDANAAAEVVLHTWADRR